MMPPRVLASGPLGQKPAGAIIDGDDNWNLLLYKEAYHIKSSAPFLLMDE